MPDFISIFYKNSFATPRIDEPLVVILLKIKN